MPEPVGTQKCVRLRLMYDTHRRAHSDPETKQSAGIMCWYYSVILIQTDWNSQLPEQQRPACRVKAKQEEPEGMSCADASWEM